MKIFIIAFFSFCIGISSFSQSNPYSIVWSEAMKGTDVFTRGGVAYDLIGEFNQSLIFKKKEGNSLIFEARNKTDLLINQSFKLRFDPSKNEDVLDLTKIYEKYLYVFTETKSKDSSSIYVYRFSSNGSMVDRTKLISTSKGIDIYSRFYELELKNKQLQLGAFVFYTKETDKKTKNDKMTLHCFDANLNKIGTKEVGSKYEGNGIYFFTFIDASTIILIDEESRRSKLKNGARLLELDFTKSEINTVPLDFCETVSDIDFVRIDNESIQIVGSYSFKGSDENTRNLAQGIFSFTLDKDMVIKNLNTSKIPVEKMEVKSKKDPSMGINGFYNTSILFDSTRSFYFKCEYSTDNGGSGPTRDGSGQISSPGSPGHSNFGTLDLFHFNTKTELIRHIQLPKKQYTSIGQEVLGGAKTIINKNKLFLLMNDNPQNVGTSFKNATSFVWGMSFFIFDFSKDGDFLRSQIVGQNNSRLYVCADYTKTISDSEYLIYVIENNSVARIGKLTFN